MSEPGLTREQVEKQRDDARVVIVTLSAENTALRSQVDTLKARISDLEHCVTGQGERLHDYCRKYAALVVERDRLNAELTECYTRMRR